MRKIFSYSHSVVLGKFISNVLSELLNYLEHNKYVVHEFEFN